MGIYHLAPIGTSPGAVTSALSYMKHNPDEFPAREDIGDIVESVILFASPEVREGTVTTTEECIHNEYGSLNAKRSHKRGSSVLDVVLQFIQTELKDVMKQGGEVYCCVVNPNDYEICFDAVASVVLHFSPPGDTGKHLWANLTGGTNMLNAALLQVAFLSGLVARAYYTFVAPAYTKYLQPSSTDAARNPERFQFDEIPMVKTAVDEAYRAFLQMLQELGDEWYTDEQLLGRFKDTAWNALSQEQAQEIAKMALRKFRNEWLNKLDGRELERAKDERGDQLNAVRLSAAGKTLLERVDSPLFKTIVARGRGEEEGVPAPEVEIETLWTKR